MNRTIPIVIGAILLLVLVLFNTTYTVRFHELAVRTRFGKPAGVERDAGLHFKMPFFIDQVAKLDTRLQLVDSPLETVMTSDQQQVVVQAYLLWKIDDGEDNALKFFTAYGTLDEANRALEAQLQGALRAIGGLAFGDLVGAKSRLPEAEKAILADLSKGSLSGVRPVSVGIAQVLLPPKTTSAVLTRMAEVQKTLARTEETRGTTEAEAKKSAARTKADTIKAFADAWAEQIAARGDQEAARYYEELAKYRDLATFLAWIDTLKSGLTGATTFVTDVNRAPFLLMDLTAATDHRGIPVPPSESDAAHGLGIAPPPKPTTEAPAKPKQGS
ncbi:MAG: SPFH domain-containing protein [Phycisphaerales bacterium]